MYSALHGSQLTLCRHRSRHHASSTNIQLKGCSVSRSRPDGSSEHQHILCIAHPDRGMRKLACVNSESLNNWLTALCRAAGSVTNRLDAALDRTHSPSHKTLDGHCSDESSHDQHAMCAEREELFQDHDVLSSEFLKQQNDPKSSKPAKNDLAEEAFAALEVERKENIRLSDERQVRSFFFVWFACSSTEPTIACM